MNTKTMTSWTLNGLVIAMLGGFFFLPEPAELRQAFEYGRTTKEIEISIRTEGAAIEIEPRIEAAARTIPVTNSAAVRCLDQFDDLDEIAVERCLPQLINTVVTFDTAARNRIGRGETVVPVSRIEDMRLAVIKLCRVKWSQNRSDGNMPEPQDCASVMSGVAY